MPLKIKRIYEPADASDGIRVLVDRLWPRGISKDRARIDEWLKEIAPSTELRTWYHHAPARWKGFIARYKAELATAEGEELLHHLGSAATRHTVTLLFSSKEEKRNNAVALQLILNARQPSKSPKRKAK
ncbi:MAG TPA: DUF488 family protein [Bacteroidota bacterium]|nr:DUF488 family protein [Bacteroidota bacterium]